MRLTEKQAAVQKFIEEAMKEGLPCPTLREIAAHFGFASTYAAVCHIQALKKKGVLLAEPGKARALRIKNMWPVNRGTIIGIPLFGSIPAGWAENRTQEAEEFISLEQMTFGFMPTRNTFALRVTGDSMTGKCICDGDVVILEAGVEPQANQVVAALIDGASTLKTFILKKGKAYLKAENPKYPDLIPTQELMVQGVFKGLIRRA
jgi:repressor LexA